MEREREEGKGRKELWKEETEERGDRREETGDRREGAR